MQKIDKNPITILSKKYLKWVDTLESVSKKHPQSSNYYDDIIMALLKCQNGVCAYTEMYICIPELYQDSNWNNDRYVINEQVPYKRNDHLGELDHFDPKLKEMQYWLWDNLFMIESKINSIKTNNRVFNYLKPDLDDYKPEKYFDYDEITHRYIPRVDIRDISKIQEIQYMIDEVLCLNHGVVRKERSNYINELKFKIKFGNSYIVDRFFTSVSWCLFV